MKNELIVGLPFENYRVTDACSNSVLGCVRTSPLHCLEYLAHPLLQTEAQTIGQAVHCAILQPEIFSEQYAEGPEVDRRTKEGRVKWDEFKEANAGKTILNHKQYSQVMNMANAVDNHTTAPKLLSPIEAEVSIFWSDKETRCDCKGRLDAWNQNIETIIDLKTTLDASPRSFERQIFALGYHRQAAWYVRGMRELGLKVANFVFLAVEKDPPYGISLFGMSKEVIAAADKENSDLLKIYADCKRSNYWPGYPDAVREVKLPLWMQEDTKPVEEF